MFGGHCQVELSNGEGCEESQNKDRNTRERHFAEPFLSRVISLLLASHLSSLPNLAGPHFASIGLVVLLERSAARDCAAELLTKLVSLSRLTTFLPGRILACFLAGNKKLSGSPDRVTTAHFARLFRLLLMPLRCHSKVVYLAGC